MMFLVSPLQKGAPPKQSIAEVETGILESGDKPMKNLWKSAIVCATLLFGALNTTTPAVAAKRMRGMRMSRTTRMGSSTRMGRSMRMGRTRSMTMYGRVRSTRSTSYRRVVLVRPVTRVHRYQRVTRVHYRPVVHTRRYRTVRYRPVVRTRSYRTVRYRPVVRTRYRRVVRVTYRPYRTVHYRPVVRYHTRRLVSYRPVVRYHTTRHVTYRPYRTSYTRYLGTRVMRGRIRVTGNSRLRRTVRRRMGMSRMNMMR